MKKKPIPENLLIEAFCRNFKGEADSKRYFDIWYIRTQYVNQWEKRKWVSIRNNKDDNMRQLRILQRGKVILEFNEL